MKSYLSAAIGFLSGMSFISPHATAQQADTWQFTGTLYGYFPSIQSKSTFPQTGASSDITVDADKIIDNLQGSLMGILEARKQRWGLFTDFMYANIDGSTSATRDLNIGHQQLPAASSANVNLTVKTTLWTLGGSYAAIAAPQGTLDVVFGARMLDVKETINWQVSGNVGPIALPGRAGNLEVSFTNWDAIVGVKGRVRLGAEGKWFAPYYADIGTGDSDRTVAVTAGIGYAFQWGDVVAAWRYVDYQMKSGGPVDNLRFNGPGIAAVFHW